MKTQEEQPSVTEPSGDFYEPPESVNDYFGMNEDPENGLVNFHYRRFSHIKSSDTSHAYRVQLGKQAMSGFIIANLLAYPFGFLWGAWLAIFLFAAGFYVYIVRNWQSEGRITLDWTFGLTFANGLKQDDLPIDWTDMVDINVHQGVNKAYFSRWVGKPKTQAVCKVTLDVSAQAPRLAGQTITIADGVDPRTAESLVEEILEARQAVYKKLNAEFFVGKTRFEV